jgi:O-methyltransferase
MSPINILDTCIPSQVIDEEPWVKLANGVDLAEWGREDMIRYNQRNRQYAKHLFFMSVFDFLKERNVLGDYFEFGCHRVRTFRMALTEARKQMMEDIRFFAFDSFEGLPECPADVDVDPWVKGGLCTTEEEFMELIREHVLFVDKVFTFKGFYKVSLTKALQQKLLTMDARASLITVDCDLIDSARDVFRFVGPFLQPGTVVYLDDMFGGYQGSPIKGVYKAFQEFMETTEFQFFPYLQVGAFGRSFIAYKES